MCSLAPRYRAVLSASREPGTPTLSNKVRSDLGKAHKSNASSFALTAPLLVPGLGSDPPLRVPLTRPPARGGTGLSLGLCGRPRMRPVRAMPRVALPGAGWFRPRSRPSPGGRAPPASGAMVQSAQGPGARAGLSAAPAAAPRLRAARLEPEPIAGDCLSQVSNRHLFPSSQHEKIKNKTRPAPLSPSSLTYFDLI